MNGIPFKIKKDTEQGAAFETVYFATFRKCPELAVKAKAIAAKERKLAAVARKAQLSANDMMNKAANASEVDAKLSEIDQYAEEGELLTAEIEKERVELVVMGLKGAGYAEIDALRIAGEIPSDRITELAQSSRLGSGALDFT